jgi:hypothetical protein
MAAFRKRTYIRSIENMDIHCTTHNQIYHKKWAHMCSIYKINTYISNIQGQGREYNNICGTCATNALKRENFEMLATKTDFIPKIYI